AYITGIAADERGAEVAIHRRSDRLRRLVAPARAWPRFAPANGAVLGRYFYIDMGRSLCGIAHRASGDRKTPLHRQPQRICLNRGYFNAHAMTPFQGPEYK